LSNVIKSAYYRPHDGMRLIEFKTVLTEHDADHSRPDEGPDAERAAEEANAINEAKRIGDQIVRDAESVAEEQIRRAMEEAASTRDAAQREIDDWWRQRREQDAHAAQEARDGGFREGYEEGLAKATEEVLASYESMLSEARRILEDSHTVKDRIIQEAEPFLIELSGQIAEKIIGRQLSVEPEWMVDLIRRTLSRRKEKGVIALCVAPKHYDYICNAREELLTSIDSQAELQILPDATVKDEGCVIRSAFGSIDARIDTQLKEIKSVLLHMAATGEGEPQ